MTYARQKFWQAVNSLVGFGSVHDRLADAALSLIRLNEDDIPPDIRTSYKSLIETLTKYPAEDNQEGAIHASVRKLSEETAVKLAQQILQIYTKLRGGI